MKGRVDIVKMSTLFRAIRFNAIAIKIPMTFFTDRKTILKFMWNHKRPWRAKAILRKYKTAEIMLLDFRIHCNTIVIKAT
jgi:hypothetical protein